MAIPLDLLEMYLSISALKENTVAKKHLKIASFSEKYNSTVLHPLAFNQSGRFKSYH